MKTSKRDKLARYEGEVSYMLRIWGRLSKLEREHVRWLQRQCRRLRQEVSYAKPKD
jgi:hypothetical protein